MPMTVIITRDVENRYRGFLSSVMLEVATGVYTGPHISKAVRERVWAVLTDWHNSLGRGAIIMTWRDPNEPGGQGLRSLGEPSRTLVETDGALLVKRDIKDTFTLP
ncbi:type I-E CRISPR-associated endoribonuclease Cas2 [Iodidimonas gelatinilytica]|uniref:Type I-E CRISPR-associated endoribonuclease Cas2 n=1 Tax=Iodidimonas gelatinilytica TaxID=1236966 RepID=A0A5A7N0M9_9PROT|nr:type I-E CRISPR-associated endoribonuclease Cas2e [Iodidimonas gelatinilytica]GEQ98237.1 type I-E CRISPR-associated endoribonuclease Cas2 [Iodidimonas gelatinilytica]GER00606.1 type I-E CRISPR-associated endoribonuclease Cas2 [Iodidimonas gelatinilytica]